MHLKLSFIISCCLQGCGNIIPCAPQASEFGVSGFQISSVATKLCIKLGPQASKISAAQFLQPSALTITRYLTPLFGVDEDREQMALYQRLYYKLRMQDRERKRLSKQRMKEARGAKIKSVPNQQYSMIIWLLLSRISLRNKMIVIVMTITIILDEISKQRMKEARGEKIKRAPNQKYSMDNMVILRRIRLRNKLIVIVITITNILDEGTDFFGQLMYA